MSTPSIVILPWSFVTLGLLLSSTALTPPKGMLMCFAECHLSWICLSPWGLKFGLCTHGVLKHTDDIGGRSGREEMDCDVSVSSELSCEETLCPTSIRAYTFIGSVWTVDFDAIFTLILGLCWEEALFLPHPPTHFIGFYHRRLNIRFILWIYPDGFWADLIRLSRKGEQVSTSPGCCKSSPPLVPVTHYLYQVTI